MKTGRLEAFSDGVIAIILTIMVLELKTPKEPTFEALRPLAPVFLSYILSFLYVAIYWNNHHHLLGVTKRVNGSILWANLHLLFWLSLTPFVTSWLGQSSGSQSATACYGGVLFMAGAAYWLLQQAIIRSQGPGSILKEAIGADYKGHGSVLSYLVAIGFSFVIPQVSWAIYFAVAVLWIVPDRRLEEILIREEESEDQPNASRGRVR